MKTLSFACLLIATLAIATPVVAQSGNGQTNCDSICSIPNPPPSDCICSIVVGGSGSIGINNPDPEAKRIIDEMRANYVAAVEGVSDYTVVQESSVGGPPVVLYYEKEYVDGFPGYRLVSPTELADRESQSNEQPGPREMAGALAGLVRGLTGGDDSESDDSGGNDEGGASAQASSESESDDQSSGSQLGGILDQLANDLEDIANAADVRESREDLADRLFTDKFFFERARHNGEVPISIDGQLIDCNELYADYHDFEPGELGEVLGDGYERFDIFYMRAWLPKDGPALVPIAIEAKIHDRNVYCTPEACPGQYVTIRRTIRDFDQNAGWVPRRETSSIDGLHNLIGNIASNFQQVVTNIKRLLLNAGPPTQESTAQLLREEGSVD